MKCANYLLWIITPILSPHQLHSPGVTSACVLCFTAHRLPFRSIWAVSRLCCPCYEHSCLGSRGRCTACLWDKALKWNRWVPINVRKCSTFQDKLFSKVVPFLYTTHSGLHEISLFHSITHTWNGQEFKYLPIERVQILSSLVVVCSWLLRLGMLLSTWNVCS